MKRLLVLAMFFLLGACGRNVAVENSGSDLDEPDKVLYDRAMQELERSRYTVARLALQTLINTYPDSEFLAQGKYLLAETFYREGTTAMLNQSETEFKDFITFFPTDPLADDAQMKVALTHVRQMEKPDRDSSQAMLAETELKRMISEYPDSPLLDEAKQKLRDVQEVLAEGVARVGSHYLLRRSYAASTDRFKEILEKYPDYSKLDEALFSLAESLQRNNNGAEAGIYYSRLVSDHPLSSYVQDSKQRLAELNLPIPDPNPVAIARAQRPEGKGIFGKMFNVFSRRPDVSTETGAASAQTLSNGQPGDSGNGNFSIDPQVVPQEQR